MKEIFTGEWIIKNQGKGMLEVYWLAVELREWFASSRSTFHCLFTTVIPILPSPTRKELEEDLTALLWARFQLSMDGLKEDRKRVLQTWAHLRLQESIRHFSFLNLFIRLLPTLILWFWSLGNVSFVFFFKLFQIYYPTNRKRFQK